MRQMHSQRPSVALLPCALPSVRHVSHRVSGRVCIDQTLFGRIAWLEWNVLCLLTLPTALALCLPGAALASIAKHLVVALRGAWEREIKSNSAVPLVTGKRVCVAGCGQGAEDDQEGGRAGGQEGRRAHPRVYCVKGPVGLGDKINHRGRRAVCSRHRCATTSIALS
jgi:hypothetical protein